MINKALRKISGFSMAVFPVMLLAGFLMHPDILSLTMSQGAEDLIANFHHQPLFHIGHLIVFFAVPLIVFALTFLMNVSVGKGGWWLFFGGMAGVVGAAVLAGDKGALCIVLSAFDTLPETDFEQVRPALQTIADRRGLLSVFYLLPLLPIGAAAQIIGLIRSGVVRVLPSILGIAGLLLLNNPDIELISSAGAFLMGVFYIPLGVRIMKGDWK